MNHKPCKCGSEAIIKNMLSDLVFSGCGSAAECPECGRRGSIEVDTLHAWFAWDADHEAVEKAREALAFTIGVLDNVIMYRTTNDAHNAKMAEVRAALALLGEDHDNS